MSQSASQGNPASGPLWGREGRKAAATLSAKIICCQGQIFFLFIILPPQSAKGEPADPIVVFLKPPNVCKLQKAPMVDVATKTERGFFSFLQKFEGLKEGCRRVLRLPGSTRKLEQNVSRKKTHVSGSSIILGTTLLPFLLQLTTPCKFENHHEYTYIFIYLNNFSYYEHLQIQYLHNPAKEKWLIH